MHDVRISLLLSQGKGRASANKKRTRRNGCSLRKQRGLLLDGTAAAAPRVPPQRSTRAVDYSSAMWEGGGGGEDFSGA